jgi:signal transduction histidine kinase
MKIWDSYKQKLMSNCMSLQTYEAGLPYWRDYLFTVTVTYLIPLSFIVLIPGIYMAYVTDLMLLIAADLIAVMGFFVIAFYPPISIKTRKAIFCFSLYLVSIVLLYFLGSFGPGLLYLLAITVFIVLITIQKFAVWSVYVNIVICVVFALLIHFDIGSSLILAEYSINEWVAVSVNLVFLSVLAVILIPKLFNGLQSTIEEKERLEHRLEKKSKDLEESVELVKSTNRELEQFAYTVSHDLKEPLRMVRSFMILLEKKYQGQLDQQAQKYINFAVDGADRMNVLIDDLLEFSRVGRLYKKTEQIDLNILMDGIVSNYIHEINAGKIRIVAEDLPKVNGVSVSLKLLFQNLISNGLKFQSGDKKPIVTVSCKEREDVWQFSVSDNGIGIDESHFERIFKLFKRLHTHEEYSGSGTGLAICQKVVEQHGGKIWIESEEGKGSTFYFTIKKQQD